MDTTTLLIIVLIILLLGGGGWYGRGRWYSTRAFTGNGKLIASLFTPLL